MAHAFAPDVAQLKRLKAKLFCSTYNAVFSNSIDERATSTANAIAVQKEMEVVLNKISKETDEVAYFMRSPYRNALSTVDSLIRLVEGECNQPEERKFN